jgi:hypothetical protein
MAEGPGQPDIQSPAAERIGRLTPARVPSPWNLGQTAGQETFVQRREAVESQITFNAEVDLTAPTGGILRSIRVEVTIDPSDAGALIYGKTQSGDFVYVEVGGGTTQLDLPFAEPHIWVKYLRGLTNLKISTLGWRDQR